MEVKFINPLCDPEWDQLAVSHPDYTFSHSTAWAKVLSKTYGHRPVYLRCSRGGELVALIPMMEVSSPLTGRRGVCLPFTDFCGALIFAKGAWASVIDKLTELTRERKWKFFEIRGATATEASATPALEFYGHTLDLNRGTEQLFTLFKSSTRRAIRKAERSCLSVQVTRTREANPGVLSASYSNAKATRTSAAAFFIFPEYPR